MVPNATQYRLAGAALGLIAALNSAMIALSAGAKLDWPLPMPLAVAFFLFNFGYLYAVTKGGLRNHGAKIGSGAVALNFLSLFISDFTSVWTALSFCAAAMAAVGAILIFRDAKGAFGAK